MFRATIHPTEEKQQLPRRFLPSGQAAMPKLITVNITIVLTLLETLRLTTSKQKNKEKLRDDSFSKDKSGFWLCSLAKK